MLIKCPDCSKEISDSATSCPNCARPMAPVTIEATGKKWKGRQVLAFWLMASCLAFGIFGAYAVAVTVFILGAAGLIWTHMGAWWEHG